MIIKIDIARLIAEIAAIQDAHAALAADLAARIGLASPATAATSASPFRVGAVAYKTLQDAFDAVNDNGVILVSGGSIFDDQGGYLRRSGVTLKSDDGSRVRFRTFTVGAKACIVQQARGFTTDGIEGEGFAISDLNGAFIRQEAPNLTMKNGLLLGCQDGILGNNLDNNLVILQNVTLDHNGTDNGQAHGIYIGYGANSEVRVLQCNGLSANVGHYIKSRAARTTLDGGTWVKGTGSRIIDASCGGVVEVKNCICAQDDSTGNYSFFGIGTDVAPAGYPVNRFIIRRTVTLKSSRHNGWNLLDNPIKAPVTKEAFTFVDLTKAPATPAPAASGPFKPVPHTNMDQLVPLLGRQFKERGNTGFTAMMSAWMGMARRGTRLYILRPGGHDDSTCNLDAFYDAATAKWTLVNPPSDYSDAVWAESNALWKAAGIDPSTLIRTHAYAPGGDLVWKDGRPVSTHSYGAICDAEEHGILHLRDAIRRFNPDTGKWTRLAGPIGGSNLPSDSYAFYADKKVYLCADIPSGQGGNYYGKIMQIDPATGDVTDHGGNRGQWYNTEACELEGGGRIFQFMRYNNVASTIDLVSGAMTNTPPLSDLFSADGLIALIHSNKTGILAIRVSGRLSKVDPVTGTVTDAGDSGIPAELLGRSARANRTWQRCRLITIGGTQKFTFPIETNAPVYEMAI